MNCWTGSRSTAGTGWIRRPGRPRACEGLVLLDLPDHDSTELESSAGGRSTRAVGRRAGLGGRPAEVRRCRPARPLSEAPGLPRRGDDGGAESSGSAWRRRPGALPGRSAPAAGVRRAAGRTGAGRLRRDRLRRRRAPGPTDRPGRGQEGGGAAAGRGRGPGGGTALGILGSRHGGGPVAVWHRAPQCRAGRSGGRTGRGRRGRAGVATARGLATGWPVLSWLVKLRPDPLRRLHLDRGGAGGRRSIRLRSVAAPCRRPPGCSRLGSRRLCARWPTTPAAG